MISLSIGIPTYERPIVLNRLLNSILTQKDIDQYQIEILIGDDSKKSVYDEISEIFMNLPNNISIEYKYHTPAKGQNDNVASLINRATGEYFCLMHDDDFFLEGAVSLLLKTAIENKNCMVFGKQLSFTDKYEYEVSEESNNFFKRNKHFSGKQKDSIEMAMLQQCPNDGYILPTELAQQIGIRSKNIVGTACDFDFALRAAVVNKINFYFIDHNTTVYAISDDSVTSSFQNNAGERKLKILYEFKTNVTHPVVFRSILKTDLSMVISYYISVRNYIEARKKLFSLKNFINYLWYKPATYIQVLKIVLNKR